MTSRIPVTRRSLTHETLPRCTIGRPCSPRRTARLCTLPLGRDHTIKQHSCSIDSACLLMRMWLSGVPWHRGSRGEESAMSSKSYSAAAESAKEQDESQTAHAQVPATTNGPRSSRITRCMSRCAWPQRSAVFGGGRYTRSCATQRSSPPCESRSGSSTSRCNATMFI